MTIKNIPMLEGEVAEEFILTAEQNSKKSTPRLTDAAKERLQSVIEKSRSFTF